jgi:Arc/MetJ-type ribon-helix-helix transcriptional regulator
MAIGEPLTVTIPAPLSDRIRARVQSGEFSSADEAVLSELSSVDPIDTDIDRWLREEIIPYCLDLDRDPSQLRTIEQLDSALEQERQRFLLAG